jgi:hypothetical protein
MWTFLGSKSWQRKQTARSSKQAVIEKGDHALRMESDYHHMGSTLRLSGRLVGTVSSHQRDSGARRETRRYHHHDFRRYLRRSIPIYDENNGTILANLEFAI